MSVAAFSLERVSGREHVNAVSLQLVSMYCVSCLAAASHLDSFQQCFIRWWTCLCQARKLDVYFETEEKLMSKSALVLFSHTVISELNNSYYLLIAW